MILQDLLFSILAVFLCILVIYTNEHWLKYDIFIDNRTNQQYSNLSGSCSVDSVSDIVVLGCLLQAQEVVGVVAR